MSALLTIFKQTQGQRFDFVNTTSLSPLVAYNRASSATAFNSAGVLTTYSADVPRFDFDPVTLQPRGWLLEGARTNSLRNSGNGGVITGILGSGASLPTNWSNFRAGGVNIEIVGSGTEFGLPYTDIRFVGTATVTGNTVVFWEATTQIAATSGQTWTASCYVTRIAGSSTNLNEQVIAASGRDGTGLQLDIVTTSIAGVTTPLNQSRAQATVTTTNASTAFVVGLLRVNVTSGNAVDVTYRIAGVQLEQGSPATSHIPTTAGAVTRAADNPRVDGANYTALFSGATSQGTLIAEFETLNVPTAAEIVAEFSDGTFNNRIFFNKNAGQFGVFAGGASQTDLQSTPTYVANGIYRVAIGWQTNNNAQSFNGATAIVDSVATIPSSLNRLEIGQKAGAVNFFGWLRGLRVEFGRLPNAMLQEARP